MMVDIFSSFDPFINLSFVGYPFIFWSFVIFSLVLVSGNFWLFQGRLLWMISYPLEIINTQSLRTFSFHIKGFSSIVVSLFVMFILVNFLGLLPYRFSYSRHMVFRLIFGLPLWLSLVVSSFINSPRTFMAGLLPAGAPDWLRPFLVGVETISIFVRPITLSVRLVANIRAGHIVLGLIGIYSSSYIFTFVRGAGVLFIIQMFYIVFEIGICLIQAYIFCLLLTLYSDDHR